MVQKSEVQRIIDDARDAIDGEVPQAEGVLQETYTALELELSTLSILDPARSEIEALMAACLEEIHRR